MKALAFKPAFNKDGREVCNVVNDGSGFKARVGTELCVYSDGHAAMLAQDFPDLIAEIREVEIRPYAGQDLSGKTLMIWRTGGFGDVLFITPTIRALKRKFPTCRILFSTRRQYMMIFQGNPDVAAQDVFPMPFPAKALDAADYHLHFEGTIEESTDPNALAYDVFARRAFVDLAPAEKRPIYAANPAATAALRTMLADAGTRSDVPWVGVQARSSSPIRTYPEHLLTKVVAKLAKKGLVVVVFGGAGHFPKGARRSGVIDACGRLTRMEDSVSLLAACDALIAPDSSMTHFAAALDIPTIALYGPFPGSARTSTYPACKTLEVDRSAWPCAPCMSHSRKPCPPAQKMKVDYAPCFETIEPGRIVSEAISAAVESRRIKEEVLENARAC